MLAPQIDPVALSIGGLEFRWYGIMYIMGFGLGWILARYRAVKTAQYLDKPWSKNEVDDLVTLTMLGVILGGRLGYILFYDLAVYIDNPAEMFKIWQGGMSFHGGLLGVLVAFWYFAKRTGRSFLQVSDFIAPFIPPGLLFGRIGNFINGELWGNVTTMPWGMVFPHGGDLPRHPSQLYEATLEGLVLFIVLWFFSSYCMKKGKIGATSGMFALLYGIFRFSVEFVRTPDVQLGYLAFNWLTMGQILCMPLILIGLYLLFRTPPKPETIVEKVSKKVVHQKNIRKRKK